MIHYTIGNLLEAKVDAVVNTVNTVGVMGKGIALMFKERYPDNFKFYQKACKEKTFSTGTLLITESGELSGARWIVNFPTKQHWRSPTKIEWVEQGLIKLAEFIQRESVRSIAIPPLGCGNGGLDWTVVKPILENHLSQLPNVEVHIYEPTQKYQNVAKKNGVQKLTPPRAMICELVRRYAVLGIECSVMEIQKLAYFLERFIVRDELSNDLKLKFQANRYGPYSDPLRHLLDQLDGSYLQCDKRLSDASPLDAVRFNESQREKVELYLRTEAKEYHDTLEAIIGFISSFESPIGLEVLSTVDWLTSREKCDLNLASVKEGITQWPHGKEAAERKSRIFSDRLLNCTIKRIRDAGLIHTDHYEV